MALIGLPSNAQMTPEANALYQQACSLEYQNNYKGAAEKLMQAIMISPRDPMLYTKLAGMYTELGDYDKALAVYSKVVELRPNDAFVYISVGSIFESKGEYKNALDAYSQALKMYPEYKYNYLNIANVQYQLRDYKASIENYNKFLETYSQHFEARESLASSYLSDNDAAKAVKEYENLYAKNVAGFKDYANFGIALFKTENYQKASEMLERAIDADPDKINARVSLALSYQELERNELALAQYDVIFRQEPELNGLRFDYANLLADMNKNNEAINQYKVYISKFPNEAKAYKNIGIVYNRIGNTDATIASYEKAIELAPEEKNIEIKEELAECYHIKNDYEKALKYYDEVLLVKKDDYNVKSNKAVLLHAMKKYDEAITMYTDLLKVKDSPSLQSNLTAALVALGEIYLNEQNYTLSTNYLERAIERGTKDSFAYYGLGKSYRACGLNERAAQYYEKAIDMDPEKRLYSDEFADFITTNAQKEVPISYKHNYYGSGELPAVSITTDPFETGNFIDTEKNKTLIQVGDENYKNKNYETSINNYQDALKINPNDEVTLLKLGNIYKAKNDIKNATNFYKKAIFVNPGYADGWFNLGLIYAGDKNLSGAKDCFNRVIALEPNYGNAYYALGLAYESEGNNNEALINYQTFIKYNPDEATQKSVEEKIKYLENSK